MGNKVDISKHQYLIYNPKKCNAKFSNFYSSFSSILMRSHLTFIYATNLLELGDMEDYACNRSHAFKEEGVLAFS